MSMAAIAKITPEARISAVIEDWAAGFRAKDSDRILTHYAEDIVQFLLAPPLQRSGVNAQKKQDLEAWFATFAGPLGYEIHDLKITQSGEVAFCHFLHRLAATSKQYGPFELWDRMTLGLREIEGHWRIAHIHASVPFYMDGSVKAAVDLKP